jgi:Tfp pilus assembly pilus retraction ATPase PilT
MDIMDRIAVSRRENVIDLNIDSLGRLTYRDRHGIPRGQGESVSPSDVDGFLDRLMTSEARSSLAEMPIGSATLSHHAAESGGPFRVMVYREDRKVCLSIRLLTEPDLTKNPASLS